MKTRYIGRMSEENQRDWRYTGTSQKMPEKLSRPVGGKAKSLEEIRISLGCGREKEKGLLWSGCTDKE